MTLNSTKFYVSYFFLFELKSVVLSFIYWFSLLVAITIALAYLNSYLKFGTTNVSAEKNFDIVISVARLSIAIAMVKTYAIRVYSKYKYFHTKYFGQGETPLLSYKFAKQEHEKWLISEKGA